MKAVNLPSHDSDITNFVLCEVRDVRMGLSFNVELKVKFIAKSLTILTSIITEGSDSLILLRIVFAIVQIS